MFISVRIKFFLVVFLLSLIVCAKASAKQKSMMADQLQYKSNVMQQQLLNKDNTTFNRSENSILQKKQLQEKITRLLISVKNLLKAGDKEKAWDILNNIIMKKFKLRLLDEAPLKTDAFMEDDGHVKVSAGTETKWRQRWNIDYIKPLYKNQFHTLLYEAGMRTKNKFILANIGLIYRQIVQNDKILGLNLFLDRDFKKRVFRANIGVEAMLSWYRLSSNYYFPINYWKKSHQSLSFRFFKQDDVDNDQLLKEKIPMGIDVSIEGIVPSIPQLSIKVTGFHWFGHYTDITEHQKKTFNSPSAMDLSLKWQPLPLLNLSIGHTFRRGKDTNHLQASIIFNLEESLKEQLQALPISYSETLYNSQQRQDAFVIRNPNVILKYKAVSMKRQCECDKYEMDLDPQPSNLSR